MNSFVTEGGEYGSAEVVTFDRDDLSPEQWENLGEIADSDRIKYVEAILENDGVLIAEIERENFG